MPDDLTDDIRQNAQGPAKAAGDAGSVEQHKLPDQIAADKYRHFSKSACLYPAIERKEPESLHSRR